MILLSHGFRPFFLAAGAYAAAMIAAWGAHLTGLAVVPGAIAPAAWHAHEMLYGSTAAAMAGFFLTATPNWSGRPPITGGPLAILVGFWLAGRLALWLPLWLPDTMPAALVAVADLAFLPALAIAVAPALAGNLKRQGIFFAVFLVMIAGNAWFHFGGSGGGGTIDGALIGLDGFVILMTVIGGRVVPSFTANHLRNAGRAADIRSVPALETGVIGSTALFALLDGAGLASGNTALAAAAGATALIAGALHAVRLAGWRGHATLDTPIVWVLHVGYLWIPAGLLLRGAAGLDLADTFDAGIHALTAGAVGTLTVAVMSRAALGHSGRPLVATPGTVAAYVLVIGGAALRVATALTGAIPPDIGYAVSAAAWGGGFAVFTVVYLPVLLGPRVTV